MKKLVNGVLGAFLVIALLSSTPLYGIKSTISKVESPIEHVAKEISLLDQIMEQAKFIVGFEDQKSLSQAKKRLISLMSSKELDVKIKDVIKDDIEIIKKTTEVSRKASQEAYDRLVIIAKQIEVQANIVAAIEEGADLVKNAPVDEKQDAIKAAQKKVQEAEQEQGMLWRLYTGVKRMITAPVNYVFGEESSKAKTAFYATVGAAVLAAGAYGASQYGVAPEETKEIFSPKKETITTLLSESDLEKKKLLDGLKKELLNFRINELELQIISVEQKKQIVDIFDSNLESFLSKLKGLKQEGKISGEDLTKLWKETESDDVFLKKQQELSIVKNEKMTNLAEIQRKYLKSPDPEDRELLYSYERDIKEKSSISWEEIYESRNKIRQEEGVGKDFELALLVKIERKYLKNDRSWLSGYVSEMFDTISPREINTLHDRVIKEIEEGVHFENITAQLMGDEETNREFKEFTQKFAPPLNIQETIESAKDKKFGFLEGRDKFANVYAKGHKFSRLFNAERIRNCIESNNFATLAVAKKWIYKVDGQWRVYAEYIPAKKARFTLEVIKELAEFAEQTGFRDWSHIVRLSSREVLPINPNVIVDKRNGKMTIIDTENKSFKVEGVMYPDKSFPQNCKLQSAYNLYGYFYKKMDNDARKWLDDYIAYLKHNPEGRTIIEPLPWSGQFDDPNFDFEKMKAELEADTNVIKY